MRSRQEAKDLAQVGSVELKGHSVPVELHGVPHNSVSEFMCVYVCVGVNACVGVSACVRVRRVCARVCVCAHTCVSCVGSVLRALSLSLFNSV